jgi:hypothetical protein
MILGAFYAWNTLGGRKDADDWSVVGSAYKESMDRE